ncbi:MAG TPA: hypothetical protein VKX29_05145 [Brumimicrobium sp.]|nr:hypothetical protein [Brumimicrobium sp.]
MKFIYTILFGSLILSSCVSNEVTTDVPEQNNEAEVVISDDSNEESAITKAIAHQWVLINRTNTEKDKNIDFSTEGSSIITQFEANGFFSIFDLIEVKEEEDKAQSLKVRSSGQWEVFNDNELTMHHSFNNSSEVESYIIEELDEQQLVIKNSERDIIDTYQRKD